MSPSSVSVLQYPIPGYVFSCVLLNIRSSLSIDICTRTHTKKLIENRNFEYTFQKWDNKLVSK